LGDGFRTVAKEKGGISKKDYSAKRAKGGQPGNEVDTIGRRGARHQDRRRGHSELNTRKRGLKVEVPEGGERCWGTLKGSTREKIGRCTQP